ncbi:MAG: hypothetical protein JXX29_21560 [Deltaproteobacteria bacterium]|nr:hypothetical protein [Deltaproteobacteria bacterium]MBN2674283.1 hypothetical protein [Deltaproteobacteria bacterium]
MKHTHQLPDVAICNQEKVGEHAVNPYMSLYRLTLQNTYADGTRSVEYPYDAVLRKWLDAVAVIMLTQIDNRPHVLLRSSIRPPLLLRSRCPIPIPETQTVHTIWELPAGLLEESDQGEDGILHRAKIEILEETGYRIPVSDIRLIAGAPFVSPGVIPERLWYTVATVTDPLLREAALGDGSPVEENAVIEWVGLETALAMCEDGAIEDMKTELGIRRIASYINREKIAME